MKNPLITVIMVSYNRPLFLRESVSSLIENAGRSDFEFWLWDNGSNKETVEEALKLKEKYGFELLLNHQNTGQQALGHLLRFAKGKYFVLTEDDMIWFQPNWLDNLVKAMETRPGITEAGQKMGFKDEWAVLATNVLVDEVNNGGMWKRKFKYMIEKEVDGITFWCNIRAGAGAMIFRTEDLRKQGVMTPYIPKFHGGLDMIIEAYDQAKGVMGHIRDTYIYHAASPYFNQLFPEVWKEKQETQTIEQAMRQWKKLGKFNFRNKTILTKLKDGTFREYAEALYKIFDNGRGRLYSFSLAEEAEGRSKTL